MKHDQKLLTARDLAERWCTSPGRLANDRSARRGVPFVRLGSSVRYRLTDVLEYENENTVRTVDVPA